VEQPPPTTITSPANSSVVATATPTLTATPVTDPDDPVEYDFQISTAEDGTGDVADSGWQDSSSWQVPVGSLQDGLTYYATVQTAIGDVWDTNSPNYVPPGAAGPTDMFTVQEGLGDGGPSPTDTVGSPPQGTSTPSQGAPSPGVATASETVNMVTGNLAVDVTTPQMQALSGPAGVTLAYNSSSASTAAGSASYGLVGQYYTYQTGSSGTPTFTGGTMVGQRTEAVNQSWGSMPPIGGMQQWQPFMVRWEGFLSLGAGTWAVGGLTSGGMRVVLNNSSTPSYNDWDGSAATSQPSFGTSTVTGPATVPIEVDDWDSGQTGNTTVQLWVQNTAVADSQTAPNFYLVTSEMLTPSFTGVPAGWSLQANAQTVQWTHADDQGNQVVVSDGLGDTETFTRTGDGVYQSPAGSTDYLSAGGGGVSDGDGGLQLSTSSLVYTFNPDGSLASATTAADNLHPAALQYTYSGSPPVLTAITDPASGNSITLSYGGTCPASLLCQISYWDGTSTTFSYNSNNQIAAVTDPGDQVTEFAYDSDNRLAGIQDALAYDYMMAGNPAGTTADTCASGTTGVALPPIYTQICYNGNGQVASVTQPEPNPAAITQCPGGSTCLRPTRTYTYGTGKTSVTIANTGVAPSGYTQSVTYDSQNRITSQTNAAGNTTYTVWNNAPPLISGTPPCNECGEDEPIVTLAPDGDQTSTVYDANGNVTATYGPAPKACFSSSTWPLWLTPPSYVTGYLPVSDPATQPGCGVTVPETQNYYDQNLTAGLAETYWSNGQFAGPAALHATGDGGQQSGSFCASGTLCAQWSAPPVSTDASGHWSVQLSGILNPPEGSDYGFGLVSSQPATLSIDGTQYLDDSPAADSGFVAGQPNTAEFGADNGIYLGASPQQIEVTFEGAANEVNEFAVYYSYYDAAQGNYPSYVIPNTALDPDYNLQTTTINADNVTTTTGYTGGGLDPAYGLPTSTTVDPTSVDPAGLNLTTTSTYEPGTGGYYLQKASTTLPGGNTTSYQYYNGTGGGTPIAAACGVASTTPQGGQLMSMTYPAPTSGAPALEKEFVYDADGRQVGLRAGPSTTISSAPWQCTSYDALSRITGQTWPATTSPTTSTPAPARTVTYDYGYNPGTGGSPLTNSVTDSIATTPLPTTTTISSTVDLLGRVVSYTDALGQTTTTSYDQAGLVSQTSGPAGTISNSYDDYGRLSIVAATSPLNSSLGQTTNLASTIYNSYGQLSGVTYGNGTTAAIGYDAYGNENSLQFTNTSSGALLAGDQVTYNTDGQIINEAVGFDGASALTNLGPSGKTDVYDSDGRLTSAYLPNGAYAEYYYNLAESSSCPSGTNTDAGDNTNRTQVTITPASGSATTTDYCYNGADQLTATITNGGTPNTNYAYDGYGNQTDDGGTSLTWDASGRDTSITTAGGSATGLTYDAVDRVISRDTNSTVTDYWYNGPSDSPAGTLNSSLQVTQAFIGLPGGVTATIQTSGIIWSYPDLHGNYTVTTNNSGTPQGSPALYDPWGQLISSQPVSNAAGGSDLGAYGADGKITDTASGIITMGARAFNPAEARFLSVDPLSGGCANAYVYAFGDPLDNPDLSGQESCAHYTKYGNYGTISVQESPGGTLAWGAKPYSWLNNFGLWFWQVTVSAPSGAAGGGGGSNITYTNNNLNDPFHWTYPPHHSIPPVSSTGQIYLAAGYEVSIWVIHEDIFGIVAYGHLTCTYT
jgi:RHS repeat-associated protein